MCVSCALYGNRFDGLVEPQLSSLHPFLQQSLRRASFAAACRCVWGAPLMPPAIMPPDPAPSPISPPATPRPSHTAPHLLACRTPARYLSMQTILQAAINGRSQAAALAGAGEPSHRSPRCCFSRFRRIPLFLLSSSRAKYPRGLSNRLSETRPTNNSHTAGAAALAGF